MTEPDLKAQIAEEIYTALERLGADVEKLAVVGSGEIRYTRRSRMLES